MQHKGYLPLSVSFSRAAAATAVVIGSLAMIGWVFDIEFLRNVYPGLPSTTMNGALSSVLIGIAIWAAAGRPKRWERNLATGCAVAVVVLAVATLAEHMTSWNLHIDQLVVRQFDDVIAKAAPGRMAPQTAIAFVLLGTALILLSRSAGMFREYAAHSISLVASLIGQLTCLGYAVASSNVYSSGVHGAMSVQIAVVLAVLGFAILCAEPQRGLMAVLSSSNAGGIVARRLLPLGLGLIPLLVFLTWLARFAGLAGSQLGGFLTLIVAILMFATPILWTSVLLYRADNKRLDAENQLAQQYQVIDALNHDLQRQAAKLQAVNQELETFSYSVSHDLRAPLRHIAGYIHLLEKRLGSQLDEQSRRYLSVIMASSTEMGTLIDDLLSFSRMGRAEMLRGRINLGTVVRRVIEELRPSIGERVVEWNIHPLPESVGDPSMIRLVLQNYISNALKFTQHRSTAMIEIGSIDDNDATVIFVRDNGAGFDMQYASKLFGVFQRLHRADEFDGTGIGLATVRRIVQRHGGKTWAEAVLDEGATFYFSLPNKPAEEVAA